MKMKKKGYAAGGALKKPTAKQAGVKKLPKDVRNKMGYMKDGGKVKKKGYAKGGMMKKKGYAKGGKVMTYNLGGMVKEQRDNRKKKK